MKQLIFLVVFLCISLAFTACARVNSPALGFNLPSAFTRIQPEDEQIVSMLFEAGGSTYRQNCKGGLEVWRGELIGGTLEHFREELVKNGYSVELSQSDKDLFTSIFSTKPGRAVLVQAYPKTLSTVYVICGYAAR
ncbi:hypothetical protein Mterra_00248 [Calidithermus terrae]|uniref:Lipoprotein n=1 Tax=Calidithermus terrae TaxID=1408545 RepID=A0A399F4R2_9DEIN|nr:hypothetical protein [Calidithermus terrae]RIH90646.1 hypothetical protein Mterra_00248 [Calidithermus terrae]